MSTPRTPLLAAALAIATLASASGCAAAPDGRLGASGRVQADSVTLVAPLIPAPLVNTEAGFATAATAMADSKGSLPKGGLPTEALPAIVVEVVAPEGTRVAKGDVVVRLDARALDADVVGAQANEAVARAQGGVLTAKLDDIRSQQQQLADKRETVVDAIASAKKSRADVVAKLGQARQSLAQLPPLPNVPPTPPALPPAPPPSSPPEELAKYQKLAAQRAALLAAIQQITSARARINAGRAQLTAGIAQLTAALAKIDAGLAKARSGLRTIDDARGKLDSAVTTINDASALVRTQIAAATQAVDAARERRSRTVILSPADGWITSVSRVGDVLAAGASVATLRTGSATVTTWLAPADVSRTCVGAAAQVAVDGVSDAVAGSVSRIGLVAEYPPTVQATDEVHLTRAIPITVSVPADLPAGVGVDLSFDPCSTKG